MNTSTKTFLFALVVSCTFIFSCGKDSVAGCGNNFYGDLESEITGLSTAATTYSTDPSVGNCEKYKDALLNYFNAFEGLRGCYGTGANKAEFDAAIDEAKDDLDDWEC
jgi:hypothetical protein